MSNKKRFIRAKQYPSGRDYDASSDDTSPLAMVLATMGLRNEELECAACGNATPSKTGMLTTPEGHVYAYALCRHCHDGLDDNPQGGRSGRVVQRIDAAHARFMASAT